jgi:predicted outer membrane protein
MKALLAAAAAVAALLMLGGGASAVTKPPVDTWWLQGSIQGNRFDIATSYHAERWAKTPEAKALAAQLVGDNRHSLGNAVQLAHSLHMSVPRTMAGLQRWTSLTLGSMIRGTRYDQAYTAMEVQNHMQAIANAQLEVKAGRVPAVVSMAKKELRMLKVHLILAQKAWTAST